jgi:ATP-dependent DNA helicase RecG
VKHPHLATETDGWDDITFLNKAKVAINGQMTRTSILLLGQPESIHHLSPVAAKLSWLLRDERDDTKDYAHFEPPFLLSVDQLFARVRNLTYRYMPAATLFPTEVTQYDSWVIREALHNCIAHQNYALGGQVTVIEESDALSFRNSGTFIPGSVESALQHNAPTEVYRNPFLVNAMVQLGMIDQIGSGIRRMFTTQQQRFFPLPDFDFSVPSNVSVRLHGRVLDEKYTRVLISQTDLSLPDVVALDKVQKGRPLSDSEFNSLKRQKLIEGRRPNIHVSANVAAATETSVDYLKKRGMDKQWCWGRVVELLEMQTTATKSDFRKLLLEKLSDARTAKQKEVFLTNLLQEMRRNGVIEKTGWGAGSKWQLCLPEPE